MTIRNKVQLITYPDSLGGNLKNLNTLLRKHFTDAFPGGIHILPPFPSSGDRGFAPLTYFEIDPAFGSWSDIQRISKQFPVVLDLMVNHISRQSPYFQDFLRKGRNSEFADFFITLDKVWKNGDPPKEDVARIFLRRPEHPFTDVMIQETGQVERIWATFGAVENPEQIDLDVHSPLTKEYFRKIFENFHRYGVSIVRLDAVAYVVKKPGTSCFFIEPEIYQFLEWIKGQSDNFGIYLLPEVHAHFRIQEKLAGHGYWVYNFALPLLVLHTLISGSSKALKDHLRVCPRRQFTQLDSHDGIPVQPDIDDILDVDSAQRVVGACLARGANLSKILSKEHRKRSDFDAHQINITYYSALSEEDNAYITARAIQFFAPGVPQVYYVGLLAGKNDLLGVERTGEKRAVNRRNYSIEEVETSLEKPVVRRLLDLINFRNSHEAFGGDFHVQESEDNELNLRWCKENSMCTLKVNLTDHRSVIEFTDSSGRIKEFIP